MGQRKIALRGRTGDSDRSANPGSRPAPPRYRSRLGDGPAPRTVGNLYTDLHFSAAPPRRYTARLIADPGQAAPARPCCARSPRWRPRSAAASSSRGSGALSAFLTTGCAAAGQRAVRDHPRRICVTMKCGQPATAKNATGNARRFPEATAGGTVVALPSVLPCGFAVRISTKLARVQALSTGVFGTKNPLERYSQPAVPDVALPASTGIARS